MRQVRLAQLLAALTLTLLLRVAPADAATRPGLPVRSSTPDPAYTPLGETVFECGTYKGNEVEHAQRRALHLRNRERVRQQLLSQPAGLDYVYDNVWVIEDDGTLTISGINQFDTQFVTHQYANTGGGVVTTSQLTFNYDANLGSILATGDDGALLVALPFSFPFGGGNHNSMYVSGNGAVSFGAPINPNGSYASADFFSSTPKIAAYYMDMDETTGGDVRVGSDPSKVTVSWINVREYGTTDINNVQLVLYPSGNFVITYNGIASTIASSGAPILTGFHPGGDPPLEEIRLTFDLPHVSAAGAAVYETYYNYPAPLVDEVALFQRFYTRFPDEFFQLVYFTNFSQEMDGALAYERNIKNDVTGIGLSIFDASEQYGSNGVLESMCNMNQLSIWSSDPAARVFGKGNSFLTIMGQEAGHRWGAFALFDRGSGPSNLMLGRDDAHWSYYADVDHSSIEGGNWQSTGATSYTCPTLIDYYSAMDEYLFGLRTPEEVKDMFYISSASNNTLSARSQGTPLQGVTANGTNVPVTVDHFIAAGGARTPVEADEQHDLRQGFIFLIQQGTAPSQAQLDKIAGLRRAWEEYFEKSCDGRLSCNTSLAGPYPVGVISGEVRDRLSQFPVPNFTAVSVERAFSQHVPGGGRFIFRYDDSPVRGTGEPVTLIFSAPGYQPDTVATNISYGQTKKFLGLETGVWLDPIASAAGELPVPTALHANHPNPFNPTTTIEYTLGAAGAVRLDVFDAAGRHVRSLVDRHEARGGHRVTFDGRDDDGRPLASGVYLYRLESGGAKLTHKMVLLK
jgi:hypothetical protein